MKYVVVLCDGMADEPLEELGGMTPLEKAHTPNLDRRRLRLPTQINWRQNQRSAWFVPCLQGWRPGAIRRTCL